MKLLLRVTLFLLIVIAPSARAVLFNMDVDVGVDNSAFPTGTLGILMIDTANDGFEALNDPLLLLNALSAGVGSLIGTNDRILLTNLAVGDTSGEGNEFLVNTTLYDTSSIPGWSSGDYLGLFWFPSGSSALNQPFGFYRTTAVDPLGGPGSIGFVTPSAGDWSLVNISTAAGGITASYTTGYDPDTMDGGLTGVIAAVPEPSVLLMVMAGSVGLFLWSRRKSGLQV